MSNFYASIQGHRGEATRQGHDAISGHIRGWNLGVRVEGRKDKATGKNSFAIYQTGGSNAREGEKLIAEISE